jgi:hypothetical protein
MDLFRDRTLLEKALLAKTEFHAFAYHAYHRFGEGPLPQMARIVKASSAASRRVGTPSRGRALFVLPRWWMAHEAIEAAMAFTLRAEGYEPHVMGCGEAAHHCDVYLPEMVPGSVCPFCRRFLRSFFEAAELPFTDYSQWCDAAKVEASTADAIRPLRVAQLLAYETADGFPLGYHTELSVVRALRVATLTDSGQVPDTFRRYLAAAAVAHAALEAAFRQEWSLLVVLNGKFFAESIAWEMARRRGIPTITYERGLWPGTMVVSVNQPANHYDTRAGFLAARDIPLSEEDEARVRDLELRRQSGQTGRISFYPDINADLARIQSEFSIDPAKPTDVAFSNIIWDTAVLRRNTAFDGLWPWIRCTVRWYCAHPERQLVLRLHPAEVRVPGMMTVERMGELVAREFPVLPPNVIVIPSESIASSYALIGMAERVLVYSTTVGLEAAMRGKPVVTCGDVHYAGLGFTRDAATEAEYLAILAEGAAPVTPEQVAWARRYGHWFFFRVSVPVKSIEEASDGAFRFTYGSLDELLEPGRYPEVSHLRAMLPPQTGHPVLATPP